MAPSPASMSTWPAVILPYVLPVLALIDGLQWFLWATTIGTYLFAGAWVVFVVSGASSTVSAMRNPPRCRG